jgi:uncharacterized protein (TIGR02147 family)
MQKSLYEFKDYKAYLSQRLSTSGELRGLRSRLAERLGCNAAFVSQVLKGTAHFSLEHAVLINDFLSHDEDETHFFMLLVQWGRAGSQRLEKYYRTQIEEILARRKLISERIGEAKSLSELDQTLYYSAWYYSAVHVLTAIPRFHDQDSIARALGISRQVTSEALEVLLRAGLVTQSNGKWKCTSARIHLNKNSPMISKHHANWRLKALQELDQRRPENLHFSGTWSFAEKDVDRIRSVLLESIERAEPILRDSKEETAFGIGLDFFRLVDPKN